MNRENLIQGQDNARAMNVALKSLDQKTAALWAADCAEHILHVFSAEYQDEWPEKAIGAAREWAHGEMSTERAREISFSANGAARDAGSGAAGFAARAAGHAAATAYIKSHAMDAADYAVKAAAAAAKDSGEAAKNERAWQYVILVKALER